MSHHTRGELSEQGALKNTHWIVLFLSMAASAGIAVRLGQDVNFDLLNYHYYSGFAFLHKPFAYDFAPAQIQSFHNPLLHVLSYLALSCLSSKIAAAFLGALQGLNFYLVFRISQTVFSDRKNPYRTILSLTSAAVGFYGISSCTELGTTIGDNMVSILILSGLWILLRYLRMDRISGSGSPEAFVFAGMLIGCASGLKLTASMYVLAVAISAAIVLVKMRCFKSLLIPLCVGLAVGFLAAYAFWGHALYSSFQNPFFPYLNNFFHSAYYDFVNFRDTRFLPENLSQTLFYPFFFIQKNQLAAEIAFRDIRFALCYLAVLLLFGFWLFRFIGLKHKSKRSGAEKPVDFRLLFLTLFFFLSYFIWQQQSSMYRFLAALELLAPVFLAMVISRFFRTRPLAFWLSMILNLIIVAASVPIHFQRQKFEEDFLKVQIPQIHELEKSVILMTGYDPISYIVPSFPVRTRFVRLSSSFSAPGRNAFLDREIRELLALYDRDHTFAYIPKMNGIGISRLDTSFYGRAIDFHRCFGINSRERNRGYLCRLEGSRIQVGERYVPELRVTHRFQEASSVQMEARAQNSYIDCYIAGMKAQYVDILYTLDGEVMAPARNWPMESPSHLRLGPMNRSGTYGIIGILNSKQADRDLWVPVHATVRIDLE
jgi:hypothetical protein